MDVKKQTDSKKVLVFSGLFQSFDEAIKNYFSDFNDLMKLTQTPIQSEDEILERAEQMDEMLDLSTSDHDMYFIFGNMIADRIEEYEKKSLEIPKVEGYEMLSMLMKNKNIKSTDLSHITPHIPEILNGKRNLSKDNAKQLAIFFKVPATVFL
jgi:HTH-type transcriptional regulator/antitoxin HigA